MVIIPLMRKHIAKVHRRVPKTKKFWIPALLTVLAAQSLAILFMWPKVEIVWKNSNKDPNEDIQLKSLIRDSQSNVFSYAVIDAPQQKVFIPELKLSMPLNNQTRELMYRYTPSDQQNSYPEEAIFSTKFHVMTLVENLNQVPCARLVRVTTSDPGQLQYNEVSAGELQLSDGRTLHLLEQKNKDCASRWVSMSPKQMVEAIKSATPY